jgi:hypothetical protein
MIDIIRFELLIGNYWIIFDLCKLVLGVGWALAQIRLGLTLIINEYRKLMEGEFMVRKTFIHKCKKCGFTTKSIWTMLEHFQESPKCVENISAPINGIELLEEPIT